MILEKPKVEFIALNLTQSMVTTSNCVEDGTSGQGGESCIGNAEHSHGGSCEDMAPLIE